MTKKEWKKGEKENKWVDDSRVILLSKIMIEERLILTPTTYITEK